MQAWDFESMQLIAKKRFVKMHKRKRLAHHNHELHFIARKIDEVLNNGIGHLITGDYSPRPLRRYCFPEETYDAVYPSDHIFQHILLQQLKPTFKHFINKNCYHLLGPTGVKHVKKRIDSVLAEGDAHFIIRADIKSFYASIPHYKLIEDIVSYYDDPKVQRMLENIVTNLIDTPEGFINPDHGIALRGPLSQFFSALYLKALDDAFDNMDVTYLRYQDDFIIFCKTRRQLQRAKQRMMAVLEERQLKLSRKKSRSGAIEEGFHFLGFDYQPTRRVDKITVTPASDAAIALSTAVQEAVAEFVHATRAPIEDHVLGPVRIVPHSRTLRKGRVQVRQMVLDGCSTRQIRRYLHRFLLWWVNTSGSWQYHELISWYVESCWDINTAAYAAVLLTERINKLHSVQIHGAGWGR